MNLSKGNRFQSQQDLFLIQQGCIKMFKSDNIYGTKYFYLKKKTACFSFCSFSVRQRIRKKLSVTDSTKKLSSTTAFKINKTCFLSSKSAWFLKDHVTLKIGVMMLKTQFCHLTNKLHLETLKAYLNCNNFFHNDTDFDVFNPTLATMVSIKDKTNKFNWKKFRLTPNFWTIDLYIVYEI